MSHSTINIVDVRRVSFSRGILSIFEDISLIFPRGKISAIIGPSGAGKTTLLRLISGQIIPNRGKIFFNGENVSSMSRSRLYTIRKKMSMLFQSDVLFNDMNLFDNIAYPLREHLALPEKLLKTTVMMKLEAVGLRGAAKLMPSKLSGGMARRAALARATALDPDLIMFDEPFVGQDPISTGILVRLITNLNTALGVTCIVVSHNISELLSISDYVCIIANKKIIAHDTTKAIRENDHPLVQQFLYGIIKEEPIPFCYPIGDYRDDLLG